MSAYTKNWKMVESTEIKTVMEVFQMVPKIQTAQHMLMPHVSQVLQFIQAGI